MRSFFKSAVMNFGPDAGENPFAGVKNLITDVINKLQSEASSEAHTAEDMFTKVMDLITALLTDNGLQSEGSSEANHMLHRDDELTNVSEKKTDLENQATKDSSKLEAAALASSVLDEEVAELHVDICASSAQQLNTDALRDGELKICATTQEDLDFDENPIIENTRIS